ncbi:STM3941 family protein [Catellatospora vulcania]|uniref:STM3941 family protein n=1 Tax=Catellatospora vulcania TaxID=1460450 RepID=UPI0012D40960|nr:STM3941 family protein [Catellatospora vulcania]
MPTVIPFAKTRWLSILLGSLAFVAVGAVMVYEHGTVEQVIGGALSVLFFGFCAAVTVQRLLRGEPELIISHDGLQVAGAPPVRWADVRSVGIRTVESHGTRKELIEVVLHDPDDYVAGTSGSVAVATRMNRSTALAARANMALGFSPLNIAPLGRKHPLAEILTAMRAHHPALEITSLPDATTGPSRVKRLLKRVAVWTGVVVVLVVGIQLWLRATGDLSTAEVGTCVTMTGDDGDSVKVVGCDATDAKYQIIAQFTHLTQAGAQAQDPCTAHPTTEVQFWYGKAGDKGVAWCFEPIP